MVVRRSLLFAHQWTRTHQFVMISSQSTLIGFAFDQAKRPRPTFMIRFAAGLQIMLLHLRPFAAYSITRAPECWYHQRAARAQPFSPAFYLCSALSGPRATELTRLAQADGKNCSRANLPPCIWRLLIVSTHDLFFHITSPINVGSKAQQLCIFSAGGITRALTHTH